MAPNFFIDNSKYNFNSSLINNELPIKSSTNTNNKLTFLQNLGLKKNNNRNMLPKLTNDIISKKCCVKIIGKKCSVCGKTFKCQYDVDNHFKNRHLVKPSKKVGVILKVGSEVISKKNIQKKHIKQTSFKCKRRKSLESYRKLDLDSSNDSFNSSLLNNNNNNSDDNNNNNNNNKEIQNLNETHQLSEEINNNLSDYYFKMILPEDSTSYYPQNNFNCDNNYTDDSIEEIELITKLRNNEITLNSSMENELTILEEESINSPQQHRHVENTQVNNIDQEVDDDVVIIEDNKSSASTLSDNNSSVDNIQCLDDDDDIVEIPQTTTNNSELFLNKFNILNGLNNHSDLKISSELTKLFEIGLKCAVEHFSNNINKNNNEFLIDDDDDDDEDDDEDFEDNGNNIQIKNDVLVKDIMNYVQLNKHQPDEQQFLNKYHNNFNNNSTNNNINSPRNDKFYPLYKNPYLESL